MDVVEKVRSTLGTYSANDVRALLKADHETIRELTKALAESKSAPQRRALLAQLKPLLVAHARAEEQAVYVPLTRLARSPDSRLAGSEGAVEHLLVDTLLERLDRAHDASTDMWRAHAKVLHESLEHHIAEEEDMVFEEVGEHFPPEEREAMAVRFAQLRAEQLQMKPAGARGNGRTPARGARARTKAPRGAVGQVRRDHAA